MKINEIVRITDEHSQQVYGVVKKIELTEGGTTYYVRFHAEMAWRSYAEKELTPIEVSDL